MNDIEKEIANFMFKMIDNDEFQKTWASFMTSNMIYSDASLKMICSFFYAFGVVDGARSQNNKKDDE